MSIQPTAQKMKTFESAAKQEEEPLGDLPVRIEIDVRSISSFLKAKPDVLVEMWDQVQHDNIDENNLLRGDGLNNFLHSILKKWYEFHNPREENKLVKAQTRTAVEEFKQLISSFCEESSTLDMNTWVLSKRDLMQFVVQMSDSGLVIPNAQRGVDVLYRNFKNHLMETPIQKYRRLKSEVSTFYESLKQSADQKAALNSMSGRVSMSNAKNDLCKISEYLSTVSGDFPGGGGNQASLTSSDLLFSNLTTHLDETSSQQSDTPILSLFSKGSLEGEWTTAIEKLETRLANLEQISGASSEAIYSDDAMSLIEFLSIRLNTLGDPAKLQSLEKQISKLITEVELIKSNTQSSSKRLKPILARPRIGKVETMFEMMSTWEKAAEQLPIVIDRLKNLQQLNMEASGVVEQVNALGARQTTLSEALSEDRQLLQSMYKRLVSSTEKIRASVKSLDERILKLSHS